MKVSIIIPIYNVCEYIEECLNSAMKQTLCDIEILCIDDGSTDGTNEIVRKYAEKDRRIRLFCNNVNKGVSNARNLGIKNASGEYIYFLDSDDMLEITAIEELYYLALKDNLDGILFDAQVIYDNEILKDKFKDYKGHRKYKYKEIQEGQELFSQFIYNDEWSASVCRQFWNRKYILSYNLHFIEGIIHEDELFSFLTLMCAKRIVVLDREYHIRRFRNNSIMTTEKTIKNVHGILKCLIEIYNFLESQDYIKCEKEVYIHLRELLFNIKNNVGNNTEWLDEFQYEDRKEQVLVQFIKMIIESEVVFTSAEMEQLKGVSQIYIYGAGSYARNLITMCIKNNISLKGVLVSDINSNPSELMGLKVIDIKNYLVEENDLVIIGVINTEYKLQILSLLKQMKIENIMIPNKL